MTERPFVLYNEPLAEIALQWLARYCDVVHCNVDDLRFPELLQRAQALIVRTYLTVDDALLDRAPGLRVVGRAGIGLDNIDVHACRQRDIQVVYTPQASTQSVVEYVLALIFDALRPRRPLEHAVEKQHWNELRRTLVGKRQLDECVVGILGLGRIGSRLAHVLNALGCRTLFHDILDIAPTQRHGATSVAVRQLFTDSDILSIHVDGRASNHHFVNAALLSHMKPDVVLINTSRGFVVDAFALAEAMQQRPEARAMIDVHEPEPPDEHYPLFGLPNAKLFPHLASRTDVGLVNMSWVVRDIAAVLEGRPPEFPAPL